VKDAVSGFTATATSLLVAHSVESSAGLLALFLQPTKSTVANANTTIDFENFILYKF